MVCLHLVYLMPIQVHGRVSDIWRSYIAQRLLWEADAYVAFAPPMVTQVRSPHNPLADMHAEHDLYAKALRLVQFLRWVSGSIFTTQQQWHFTTHHHNASQSHVLDENNPEMRSAIAAVPAVASCLSFE